MEGVPYFGEYGYVPPQKGKFPFKEVAIGFGVLVLIGIAIYSLRKYFKKPGIEAKNQLSSDEGTQEQTVPKSSDLKLEIYSTVAPNQIKDYIYVTHFNGYIHKSQSHLLN